MDRSAPNLGSSATFLTGELLFKSTPSEFATWNLVSALLITFFGQAQLKGRMARTRSDPFDLRYLRQISGNG
jgi:hypothetical protein